MFLFSTLKLDSFIDLDCDFFDVLIPSILPGSLKNVFTSGSFDISSYLIPFLIPNSSANASPFSLSSLIDCCSFDFSA